jgi:hypothetical protein
MLSNGNDLRIVYWNGSFLVEIDRDIIDMNSGSTQVWFKTRADIPASGTDTNYYMYYGNPSAANPPANKSNVCDFWDDFDDGSVDAAWTFSQTGAASGSCSESGTVVVLNATTSGDLWDTSDNFLFLSISRSYDVLVESYTSSWGGSHDTWSKMGGVQLRQSLDANSKNRIMSPVYSFVGATNSYRLSTGGSTNEQTSSTQPKYCRLSRVGGTSRAWYSTDGVSWTELGSQISFSGGLSNPVRLGIYLAGLSSSAHWVEVDWFKVRKYVNPEPSTSLDSEESDIKDYVDNNVSDVDSSADKGTHSNFTAQQYSDLINDTLTEADQVPISGDSENFVDSNSSNVDGHVGHGTSSNFTAQQDSNIVYNDTLTEANTGGTVNTEDFVDGNLSNVDAHVGHGTSSNFTAQKDANIAYNDTLTEANTSNSTGVLGYSTASTTGYTDIENQVAGSLFTTSSACWVSTIMAYIYDSSATKTSKAAIYRHSDLALIAQSGEITLAISTAWRTYTFSQPYPSLTASTDYILVVWSYSGTGYARLYYATGTSNQGHIDPNTYGANFANPMVVSSHNAFKYDINASLIIPNYEMDYEFNYTVADFGQTNEELCIRTNTFAGTVAENLKVDWWNATSSAWLNINSSLVVSAWNNISISTYLTSANIYFRFLGATEASDSSQNTWIIECNMVHYWTDPNYELDYEFQWTTASFSETNEYLCVRTYTLNGEALKVDWWNTTSSAWLNINSSLVASAWNNISISSYLTLATITFRFLGGTESSDTTQSTWIIECNLIHVWSVGINYELDLEEQFTSANFSRTNEELCIRMGAMNGETLSVQWWNATGSSWLTIIASLTANDWNNVSVTSYLTSATFTIRYKGGTETDDTNQDSWQIDAALLHVWTESTYDHVLQVVNQVDDNWTINLQVYDTSNIVPRLLKTTISFHDGSSSDQIIVDDGAVTQTEGPPYSLTGNATVYISVSNLQSINAETSYLYVYLKIRIPNTTTYLLYVITFEVT